MITLMKSFEERPNPHIAEFRCNHCDHVFRFGRLTTYGDIREALEQHKRQCPRAGSVIAAPSSFAPSNIQSKEL